VTKKPKEKRPPKPPALVKRNEEDARRGLSSWPSDTCFEYDWPPGDPAWAWTTAIDAADLEDPAYLFELVIAGPPPECVRPMLKDLFDRKFGPPKPGPQTSLLHLPMIERAAIIMARYIKQEGLSVEAAADRVRKEYTLRGIERDALINHYSGKTGYGRRWKKRRPPP
jgi:hypothetical protein